MDKDKFLIKILTKNGFVLQKEIVYCLLPGIYGEIGVLVGHSPSLVKLTKGKIKIRFAEETKEQSFDIDGGFAEIKQDRVYLFAQGIDYKVLDECA